MPVEFQNALRFVVFLLFVFLLSATIPWFALTCLAAWYTSLVLITKTGGVASQLSIAFLVSISITPIAAFVYAKSWRLLGKFLRSFSSTEFASPFASISAIVVSGSGLALSGGFLYLTFLKPIILFHPQPENHYNKGPWRKGIDLSGRDLRGVDTQSMNLMGANLRKANLAGTDLGRARLRGADLRSANLSYADLFEANLLDANLEGANLTDANLTEAKFCNTRMPDRTIRNSDCWYRNRPAGGRTSCYKTFYWRLCPYLP
jgi:hypothetical protein